MLGRFREAATRAAGLLLFFAADLEASRMRLKGLDRVQHDVPERSVLLIEENERKEERTGSQAGGEAGH